MAFSNNVFRTIYTFSKLWSRSTARLVRVTAASNSHRWRESNTQGMQPQHESDHESTSQSESGSNERSQQSRRQRTASRKDQASTTNQSTATSSNYTIISSRQWLMLFQFIRFHHVVILFLVIGNILLGEVQSSVCSLWRSIYDLHAL